jgi:hypothetical protein
MLINKCHLQIQYKEATKFMIETAKYDSKITFDEIKKWLDNNCNKIEQKDVEVYLNQAFVNLTLGGDENGE